MDNNLDPKNREKGFSLPGRPAEPPLAKHPYTLYIILTAVLFALMMAIVYFAVNTDGFIPQRLQKNA